MKAKFTVKGHPIHPAMVALPIGLYFGTLLSDIAYYVSNHDLMWVNVSFWAGIWAIVTALIAAFFGLGDYTTIQSTDQPLHKVATTHMLSNIATVILFVIAAFLLRSQSGMAGNNMGLVTGLHVIGIITMFAAGYLGGQMVYKHRMAVLNDQELAEVEGRGKVRPSGA